MRVLSILYLFVTFLFAGSLFSENWQDIDKGEKKFYGSERLDKFKQDTVYFQLEDWEGHYSYKLFQILEYKDYPDYTSFQVFPFYSYQASKIDDREKKCFLFYSQKKGKNYESKQFFPLVFYESDQDLSSSSSLVFPFYYKEDLKSSSSLYTPLSYHHNTENFNENFIFPLYYEKRGEHFQRQFLLPFYMREIDETKDWTYLFLYSSRLSRNGDYHRNFLGLLDWYGTASGMNEFNVYPLAYHKEKNYTHIFPFYSHTKNLDTVPLLAYYSYEDEKQKELWLGPYYSSKRKDAKENYRHIFPFSFRYEDENEKESLSFLSYYNSETKNGDYHRNFLGLFDWYGTASGMNELNVYPLAYHKEKNYTHIFPFYSHTKNLDTVPLLAYYSYEDEKQKELWLGPYYSSKRKDAKENYRHIFPFSFRYEDENEKESLSFLSYYNYETKNGDYHRNFLGLFDWYGTASGMNELNVYPLAYHKEKNYTHIFPFYSHTKNLDTVPLLAYYSYEDEKQKELWLGPYYSSKRKDAKENYRHIFPFSFRYEDENEKESLSFLSYYNYETKNGDYHRNFLGLFDWYGTASGMNELNVYPLAYHKEKDYTHIFPFYSHTKNLDTVPLLAYYSYEDEKQEELWLGPYYSLKRKDAKENYRHIFPFSFRYENENEKESLSFLSYYNSETKNGDYHRNFLGLLDWYGTASGMNELNVYPLVSYKQDSYLFLVPLYFRPQAYSSEKGKAFGFFYYHNWRKNEESFFLGPYYSYKNSENNTHRKFSFYKYEWKGPETEGEISPFEVSYKNENYDYYLNLLGFMKSRAEGPLSQDLDFALDKNSGEIYIDTDTYFAFNLFSISRRNVISLPFKEYYKKFGTELKKDTDEKEESGVILSKYKMVERDKARSYYGWSALLGMLSYEESDSRRHFRALPLYWISWDEKSKDQLQVNPFYFSYASEEIYYHVFSPILPLYASQKEKNSSIDAYLLAFFIKEYDKKEDRNEYTLLWPFMNYYTSSTEKGYRVLPFVWKKETEERSIFLSPVYISSKNPEQSFSLSFLHYESNRKQENYTFYTSINPLVFQKIFSKEKNISLESIKFYPLLLSYQYESDDRKFNHYGLLYTSYENAKENYKNIAVLYNTYKTENLNEEFLIPLYYYKYNISDGSQRFNFLGLFDLQTSKNYTSRLFFPFYYSEKDKNSETLFATLYYSSKNLDTENQKQVQISPLSYTETVKSGDYERKTVLNPLYYKNQTRYKSEVGTETFIPALALWHSKDERQEKWNIAGILSSTKIKDSIEKAFLPFYYSFHSIHSEDITYIFPYYNKENSHSSISTLFPFYYYKQNKESENKETSFYSPLYIRETHSSENGIKSSSNLILPILLSFGKEGDTAKLSFAGLFHLSYDLSNLEILALPFYYFSQQDGKNVQASLLHYYKRDKNSELAINPIYSYGKDGKENEKEYKHWSLIPGLLYYSKETAEGVTKNIAGVFQYKKYPEYIQYHILPMLYYSKKKEDKKLFVAGYYKKEDKVSDEKVQSLGLGSLFYKKKKGNRVVKSILSGLLYYKDENNLEKKERELYLGGSLYYNLKKKQRGYRTRGLLAGLLWKQKTEEENAYKETSFLLDSFRVIRYKDKTSYRILGLRI